jgi:hypothetical protein
MTAFYRWWPTAVAAFVAVITAFLLMSVRNEEFVLPMLPAAVHVALRPVPEFAAETSRPLFAPSRSNVPLGPVADAPPPVPPPALTGVIVGGSRAVALVKGKDGKTSMIHIGDTVDGWVLRVIEPRRVEMERNGERQPVELLFARPQAASNGLSVLKAPAGG